MGVLCSFEGKYRRFTFGTRLTSGSELSMRRKRKLYLYLYKLNLHDVINSKISIKITRYYERQKRRGDTDGTTVSVIRKFPFRISFTIVERSSNDRCGIVAASLQNRT